MIIVLFNINIKELAVSSMIIKG